MGQLRNWRIAIKSADMAVPAMTPTSFVVSRTNLPNGVEERKYELSLAAIGIGYIWIAYRSWWRRWQAD